MPSSTPRSARSCTSTLVSTASCSRPATATNPALQMNLFRWVGVSASTPGDGNVKGLQDPYRNPTRRRAGPSVGQNPAMVTSFADGSKISFEQPSSPTRTGFRCSRGMSSGCFRRLPDGHPEALRYRGAPRAGRDRRLHGRPAGVKVFCLAEHRSEAAPLPRSLQDGRGTALPFWIPYHLVHFEAPNSIARVVLFGDEVAPPLGGPVSRSARSRSAISGPAKRSTSTACT